MQKTYRELTEEVKMDDERLHLIAALGSSEDIVCHYHLICEDRATGEQLSLENSFDRHGKKDTVSLLEQLRADESSQQYTDTAYLAAKTPPRLRRRGFYAMLSKEFTTLLLAGPEAREDTLHRKCITTLDWVDSAVEIDILTGSLRGDPDTPCHAWAAASLIQLSFHAIVAETVREKMETIFAEVTRKENNLCVAGITLEAVQALFRKRWISATAVEAAKPKAISKAGKSASCLLAGCSAEQTD